MMFTLRTDRALARAANRSTRYLHVSLAAPLAAPRADRPPLAVAFVLDRSGSMEGEKIRLAREAVEAALRMLSPHDVFSIVTYDERVDVLVPAVRASAEAKRMASERLRTVDARGATDLCAGWLKGCEQVADGDGVGSVGRCFVLSDGQANRGVKGVDELASRAGQLRTAHVLTSTFGVGRDFDERLMASMARSGGGNFYYIEHARQIADFLGSELGEALEVVARKAVVEIEVPAGMDAEVLHDFRNETSGGRLRISLDDLVSGQDVELIVKLHLPAGELGDHVSVRAKLSSSDGVLAGEQAVEWTFASHATNDGQPRDRVVDRLVAEIYAAHARKKAVEFNRAGDYAAALSVVRATSARIRGYAGADAAILDTAAALVREEAAFREPMEPAALKAQYYGSHVVMHSRAPSGTAKRRNAP